MKKSLLLILALSIGIMGFSQKAVLKPGIKSVKAVTEQRIGIEPLVTAPSIVSAQPEMKSGDATNAVTIVTLGSSANAYGWGYAGGQKTLVWADDDINTVTLFHRMGGPQDPGGYSGDLGYDVSKDGGNTWTKMVECWTAQENSGGTYYEDAGRYPNHGIYNPAGNTDPNNAWVSFFAPTLAGTNGAGSWGGYAIGTSRIGDPTDTTREHRRQSPTPGVFQYIPDGYTVTETTKEAWVTDLHQDWTTGTVVYMGNVLSNHGIWNTAENKFEYTEYLVDFPTIDGSRPAHDKVAFGPDGLTGYIAVLADNGEVPFAAGNSYFPILYKTTDGGMSWEGPISITLGGPDGIWEVMNYLTDAQIAELFLPPLPARDEIQYTTAFDFDLAVDAWGNPHIAVVVGPTGSDVYSIVSAYPFTCVMDLTSLDGGQTWMAHQMGRPKAFRGTFGADYTEDNRTQISSTKDGSKIFVSWLDTDLPGITDNNQPDIYCRGLDVAQNKLTAVDSSGVILDRAHNVTAFSEGMWQSFFGTASTYVFEDATGWTIPLAYEEMANPQDPASVVTFKYILDFKFTNADFLITSVNEQPEMKNNFTVNQRNFSTFDVTLSQPAKVTVSVTNLTGQVVNSIPAANYTSGTHQFTVATDNLPGGIYVVTVQAGTERISRKMIVR